MPHLADLPLARFCHFVWWWATRNAEKQSDIDRLRSQLWMPPRGAPAPTAGPWSPEAETAAFKALKSSLGIGSASTAGRDTSRPPTMPAVRQGRGLEGGAPS